MFVFPIITLIFFLEEEFSTETVLQTKSYIRNFSKLVTVDNYLAREVWINRSDHIDLN